MTPEEIEFLERLKELKDEGVLSEEEFESQKRLVLNSDAVEPGPKTTSVPETNNEEPSQLLHSEDDELSTKSESDETERASKVAAVLVVVALLAVAFSVFVFRPGRDEPESSGANSTSPTRTVVTPSTSATPSTEAPREVDLVNESDVWLRNMLMVKCANQVVTSSGSDSMTRTQLVEEHQPTQSYMAGVSLRVAELIETTDWNADDPTNSAMLQALITQMVELLRENALLSSIASRTSPEAWNDLGQSFVVLNFAERFEGLESAINVRRGIGRFGIPSEVLDVVGEGASWCNYLSWYEENPPDMSYFRPQKNFTDEFWDYDLRRVCGMLRDLQVPNGDNPEANISYLKSQAQRLYEKLENDSLYSLPQSRFYYLGIDLAATMEVFSRRSDQYMPLSHMSAVEDCEQLGW